jgi:hypothetical protein
MYPVGNTRPPMNPFRRFIRKVPPTSRALYTKPLLMGSDCSTAQPFPPSVAQRSSHRAARNRTGYNVRASGSASRSTWRQNANAPPDLRNAGQVKLLVSSAASRHSSLSSSSPPSPVNASNASLIAPANSARVASTVYAANGAPVETEVIASRGEAGLMAADLWAEVDRRRD